MSERPLSEQLSRADLSTLQEMMRLAEVHLEAQRQTAIAADQRAYTFAGFSSATATILVGAAYALGSQTELGKVATVVAFFLVAACGIAIWSARSVGFEFAGSQPGVWLEDIKSRTSLERSLAEQLEHYDGMIAANRRVMDSNSRYFSAATLLGFGAVVYGACAFARWSF